MKALFQNDSPSLRKLCKNLTFEDLNRTRIALHVDEFNCLYPISDRDGYITTLNGINKQTAILYPLITRFGSIQTLFEMVNKSNFELVNWLLDQGVDFHQLSPTGGSILDAAVDSENWEMIQLLLDRGVDINLKDDEGRNALTRAAWFNQPEIVEKLLEKGIQKQPEAMFRAIESSIEDDNIDVIKILLKFGYDPTGNPEHGVNLVNAARIGNVELVRLLLDAGADPKIPDDTGITVLTALSAHPSPELIQELIERGVDVNAVAADEDNLTAYLNAVAHGQIDNLKILEKAGANLFNQTSTGLNAFGLAVKEDQEVVISYLIDQGADPNQIVGNSPAIIYAAKHGLNRSAKALVHHANLEVKNNKSRTALMSAVKRGYFQIVETLLRAGASTETKDNEGETALFYAIIGQHIDIVKILIKAGANLEVEDDSDHNFTPLLLAIAQGNFKIVKLLIKAGATLRSNKFGISPLMIAVYNNRNEIVEYLIGLGVDVNEISQKPKGTALIYAIQKRNEPIIKMLLEAGANPNLSDPTFGSAFEMAIIIDQVRGWASMISMFLENGADISLLSEGGQKYLRKNYPELIYNT